MNKRNIITRFSIAALLLSAPVTYAQDIHFSQFDMQPLAFNPAFTGMFYGKMRASAIYRSQWNDITKAFKTTAVSVDVPLKSEKNGDYLAGGLQIYQDQAGDGNLTNTTALASIAYHKTFGSNTNDYRGSDLAFGFQGGYAQKSIDLTKLYFGDEFHNGTFAQGTTGEKNLGNSVSYFIVNAGISFAQAAGPNFSYVIGLSGNNLNQPNDNVLKQAGTSAVLDMRYCADLGVIWNVGQKLSLRPALLFQYQASATELIIGNEFHYSLTNEYGETHFTPSVFVGGWLRNEDAFIVNGGFEIKNFRVAMSYDMIISSLNTVSSSGAMK